MTVAATGNDTVDAAKIAADAEAKVKADADAKVIADKKAADDKIVADAEAEKKAAEAAKPTPIAETDLKLAEGATLPKEALKEIADIATRLGLSKEQAQKLLDRENAMFTSMQAAQKETRAKTVEGWKTEIANDKEIGGADLKKNLELSKRIIDKFGSELFRKTITETGIDNNPELLRFIVRIAKASSEDTLVLGDTTKGGDKESTANMLFGKGSIAPKVGAGK